jgi:hypothetical protein
MPFPLQILCNTKFLHSDHVTAGKLILGLTIQLLSFSFFFQLLSKAQLSQALVAHACNPSYAGHGDPGGLWFKVSPEQIVCETLSGK